ncbi:HAD-IA family hydrolase [bacterium]|nr:HAD-IA family hydrolase [bacterium]
MDRIKAIFFDLDNTLFDHARAERTALVSVIRKNPKVFSQTSEEGFIKIYDKHNKILWKKMAEGGITAEELKLQRFACALEEANCPMELANEMSVAYLAEYSKCGYALPNAKETLSYLRPRYTLAILSNGFPAIQEAKLKNTALASFFSYKIYSSELGVMKPDPKIFFKAMQITKVHAKEAAYVGDSYEDDICSSKEVGWLAIYFDANGSFSGDGPADFYITNLSELTAIF